MQKLAELVNAPGPVREKFYAGIGSRNTPVRIQMLMAKIASTLEMKSMILRSGGAQGADLAFEGGVTDPKMKDIFLPWKGFNGNPSRYFDPPPEAFEIASRFHPYWIGLKGPTRSLMARNSQQILGKDCNKPNLVSRFVICWTPDGATATTGPSTGGTGQAIRIAISYRVPVFNLQNYFPEERSEPLTDRFDPLQIPEDLVL